ncbi:hypothetical protein M422DRAFT_239000 [Sphaerobolus stellatus SS14]|nr:hypothetical protein M422DRAFT_239000 [Sphaerobolus stellatus SS14]
MGANGAHTSIRTSTAGLWVTRFTSLDDNKDVLWIQAYSGYIMARCRRIIRGGTSTGDVELSEGVWLTECRTVYALDQWMSMTAKQVIFEREGPPLSSSCHLPTASYTRSFLPHTASPTHPTSPLATMFTFTNSLYTLLAASLLYVPVSAGLVKRQDIVPPVLYPTAGVQWMIGTSQNVTW